MILSEENFTLFAAMSYTNTGCIDPIEFEDDLAHIKSIKKLLCQYKSKGILKERLILNHMVILYNVFDARSCTKMILFKLSDYIEQIIPFLIILGYNTPEFEKIKCDPIVVKILQTTIYRESI